MMEVVNRKSCRINRIEKKENGLYLSSELYCIRLKPQTDWIIEVSMLETDCFAVENNDNYQDLSKTVEWSYTSEQDTISLVTKNMKVAIDRNTGSITYMRKDKTVLVAERKEQAKQIESFEVYRTLVDENTKTKTIQTADGVKTCIEQATQVYDRNLYHTSIYFTMDNDEVLYGLGQTDDGVFNLRYTTNYIHQANRKIAIPFLVSVKGYGILLSTESAAVFSEDKDNEISLSTYADEMLDYYLIAGEDLNEVVKGFRRITGKAVMLPKWAYGYIQSFERYETQQEIVDTVKEFRRRHIGIDAIVLDWLSWEDGMWGQKSFDRKRFPDVRQMMKNLHEEQAHFMLSIWPNMTSISDNYKEMYAEGKILPGTEVYNAFEPKARELYWKQANEGWFQYGIDGWWCDSSEALTPEWNHATRKPQPYEMWKEFIEETQKVMPAPKANAYGLYHARGIYEGQRKVDNQKRVMNLTRSGYPGSQKYGTVLWSGDIEASWTSLKNQIVAGLNFCASGMPYWTLDIGAFFVKRGAQWYWDGDFDDGLEDFGYRELYTRWYQYGAFLPMFRSHGTDCRREPWNFGEEGEVFYDAICKANKLRYQLIPYIYSIAAKVSSEGALIMRPLAFDFKDKETYEIKDQFLFGPSMMICPITEPMLYYAKGVKVDQVIKKTIYLPAGTSWYDFYTKQKYEGGQILEIDMTIDHIPVYVKAGGIIPMIDVVESTEAAEGQDIHVEVYAGADGSFDLYEDNGDGYDYEDGEYAITNIQYHDKKIEVKTSGQMCYRKGNITVNIING